MIRKNKLIALWMWLAICLPLSAQLPGSETSQVMTVAQYFDLVLSNHPIAQQVRLDNKIAQAAILKARGAFDPKVGWKDGGKTLSGVSYYEAQSSYLTVPTWFGIELTAGRDQITGTNVDPSQKTPDQGLYYAGISIPLGAGFWINERMAELKKAKIAQTQTQAEQVLAYNELLFRASQAYGNWIAAHQKLNLYDQMQANAELRLAGVQQQVLQGDKPEIERLEASIVVQNRNLQREQAKIELIKKTLEVSNFLWDEQGRPLVLAPELIPEDSLDEVLERWLVIEGIDVAQTVLNHPKMDYLRAKIAEREIVKKGLSIEQIKQYVKEDGANINKDNCVALLHAVEENNHEKAKVILELGGSPNLRSKADAIINKAQDLDMIKLLVSNGSELTGEVFNNICNDLEAVEYCLKQGLDPNFDNSLPIRRCCKGGWKTKDDIGEGYFDVFQLLVKYGAKLADEGGRNMAIKWAAEYGRLNFIDYMLEKGVKTGFKAALSWLKHSRKIPDDKKAITIAYLEDKIKEHVDV